MTKTQKITYWVSTVWLALGMLSAGIVQILKIPMEIEMITHLGYPIYFLYILGISKLLGVAAILAPKFPRLKEWAYAGFAFTLIGAIFSTLAVGDSIAVVIPPLLLLVLTMTSWYFRPASKKLIK